MPQTIEWVIATLQARAEPDSPDMGLLPVEAKMLVDYINQLRIQAARLHEAGMDCVSRAHEYGPPPVNASEAGLGRPVSGLSPCPAAHYATEPMRKLIGSPGAWIAQAVQALKRHVGGGG